ELGEYVAHRFGVHAVTPGPTVDRGQRRRGRAVQAGGGQDGVEDRVEGGRLANAAGDDSERVGVGAEQLAGQRPQDVEGRLSLLMRQGGAVAEPDDPARRVVT